MNEIYTVAWFLSCSLNLARKWIKWPSILYLFISFLQFELCKKMNWMTINTISLHFSLTVWALQENELMTSILYLFISLLQFELCKKMNEITINTISLHFSLAVWALQENERNNHQYYISSFLSCSLSFARKWTK